MYAPTKAVISCVQSGLAGALGAASAGAGRRLFLCVVAALIVAESATAQVGSSAQISGIVRDETGAVLPGAVVAATQVDTGFKRTVVADDTGSYILPNLPIGPYHLQVGLSRFRPYTRTGIVLQVNANPIVNVTLLVGDLTETVTVKAGTSLVETRSTSIGQVIENERIEELPLNGRQATELIALAGAAVRPGGVSDASSKSMQGGVGIAVAGGQPSGVAYLLDGAMHNNPYDNLNLPLPFPDALQEFRVETSTTMASNGLHSSATVNAVTKSGTNVLHGDLFEFVRNHRFNATNRFNAIDPLTRERIDDGLSRHQYGGTLGGPLRRDRLFLFGAYQGTRLRETAANLFAFVPTSAMLAGDFTQYASAACNTAGDVNLRGAFVANRIDPARLSPAALRIADRLPKTSDPCGRVEYRRSRPQDEAQIIGKLDARLTANHSLFGRYIVTTVNVTPPLEVQPDNLLVSSEGGRDNRAHAFTIGDTFVLSDKTVNSFRAAFTYTDIHRRHAPLGFDAADVGIKAFSYLEDYMLVTVSNGGFQLGGGMESEARFRTSAYQLGDDLTTINGNHQLGVGGSVAYWNSLSRANVRSPGQFNFDGSVTGLPLADFLTGSLAQLFQTAPNGLDIGQWSVGLYAQDAWKLSPRATLNYGIRWEPGLAPRFRDGAVYNFSVERFLRGERSTQFTKAPAGLLYPGDPGFVNGKAGRSDQWRHFSPRVGFSWDPTGDGRTSIRAGYSLAYDFINAQALLSTSVGPPYGADARVNLPAGGFDNPWLGTGNETYFPYSFRSDSPFPLTGTYVAIPPDIEVPRQQSWNAGVQRQIGPNLAVSVTYLGSYSDRLWNLRSVNPGVYIPGACTLQTPTGAVLYPTCSINGNLNNRRRLTMQNYDTGRFLGAIDEYTADVEQRYHGLLLSAQRRSANGLSLSTNYTLSTCMGHPTQVGGTPMTSTGYVNPDDPDYDYGPCDHDRRHIVNLSAGVQTPDFRHVVLRTVASNWRVSGILRLASGRRLNITVTTDPARTGIVGQRPNLTSSNPYGDRSYNNYLNPAAFADPAVGTLGNLQRNALVAPMSKGADIAIVRSFRVANTHRIEARIEAFNAGNWFNPATSISGVNNSPVVNRNNVLFGRITAADDPRIMQFAVKYSF